ncbi:MAG: alpha/beta fold hydrolase [Paracoccaceae bacterium]
MQLMDFITDLPLANGGVLRNALCRYGVWGKLNEAQDNLVLFPTRFGGTHEQNAFLIGKNRALDPEKYCIVVPNMLGNGESSSPSNTSDFPQVDHRDNVELQRRMLRLNFRDAPLRLAVGWSMGAQQSYRWAVEEPDRIMALITICGTARTTPHNRVFLEALLAALEADPDFATGATPRKGLRAVGRIYAGWAYSQPWLKRHAFTDELYGGYTSLDDWLENYWDALFMARDAGNIVTCAKTWIANDVADGGDLPAALGRVTAKTLVMTASTDLYFTPADCIAEAAMIPGAEYRTIETDWGHMAGSGQSPKDTRTIDAAIGEILNA